MPAKIMSTSSSNPKLTFYKLLHQFLTAPEFITLVAEELVRLRAEQNTGITCSDFDLADLEETHTELHGYNHPQYNDWTSSLIDAFFRDMAPQLRTEEVQILVQKYGQLQRYENMLMVRLERLKLFGKGFGTGPAAKITITVNDWRIFCQHMNWQLPEKVWEGEVPEKRDEILWSCTPQISQELHIPQHFSLK